MNVVSIPLAQLQPNDYNPNRLNEAQYAELLAEVKLLGRVPKPVVVRGAAAPYTIVDGEHGWRAAREAGLSEVACEIVDVDDFEAMRQTYKRNQHGEMSPTAQGQMFRRMMASRKLSQRALAAEIGVSEGTVRNCLMYAEAAEVRNGYAFDTLTVKQIRAFLALPADQREAWLYEGPALDCLKELTETPLSLNETIEEYKARCAPISECVEQALAWQNSKDLTVDDIPMLKRQADLFLKIQNHFAESAVSDARAIGAILLSLENREDSTPLIQEVQRDSPPPWLPSVGQQAFGNYHHNEESRTINIRRADADEGCPDYVFVSQISSTGIDKEGLLEYMRRPIRATHVTMAVKGFGCISPESVEWEHIPCENKEAFLLPTR